MAQLQDKIALVTGAAAGIGKQIALTFGREGAKIAVADLNLTAAQAAVDELAGLGIEAMPVAMDVSDEAAVEAGVAAVIAKWGRVDVLVSNAGIQIVHPIEDFPFADWRKVMAIHLDEGLHPLDV